ncbi:MULTISPECIES: hypothetical protein [Halorussus]|uniref:hypothetical protein n=1 Tax=Halorussus TaxID=1070314 RepID=UPI00209E1EFD|nr:hypothetical protein [Halorussus vallis]USZ73909.1 hypothetical protein NGM07_10615 [Halorussus vallis]
MKRPNLTHAAAIARVEFVRNLREIRSSSTKLLAFGFALVFWVGLPTVGGGYLAYRLGASLPETQFPVLDLVRGATAVGWVGGAALAAARAAGKRGELDAEAGILTTVPARDAALGLELAEYLRMGVVAAIPVAAVSVALAVGSGSVAPLVAVPATVAALLAVALSLGFPLGIGIKWVTLRTPWLARNKTVLVFLAFGLYFLAVMSEALNDAVATLQQLLRDTPLAWFGDAGLLGLPGLAANPVHALGAAAMAAALVPTLAAVGVWAATTLWYADRAQAETKEEREGVESREGRRGSRTASPSRATRSTRANAGSAGYASSAGLVERALSKAVGRPTRTVTLAAWRRIRRAPIKILYVSYPLFFLYAPLRAAFESGVPSSLPVLVALYGTWAVGATVLNPLGDEGAVLPTTLLSGVEGREFVAGHVLSAALVGVPVVAGATALTGAASPLAPARWLALTALSALLVVAGSVLAVGVGALFPRFDSVEVFRSREVPMPSKGAFAVYSLSLLGGTAGAVVAAIPAFAALLEGVLGINVGVVRALGAGLAVLVGAVGPVAAYRYATRTFEDFAFD